MYVYDCTNQKCTCTCTYNDKFPYVQVHYIILHKIHIEYMQYAHNLDAS